jgi:hypothetical protein
MALTSAAETKRSAANVRNLLWVLIRIGNAARRRHWLADDAVHSEPVSGPLFPDNREKYREIYESRPVAAFGNAQISRCFGNFRCDSLNDRTGNFWGENRETIFNNREFPAPAPRIIPPKNEEIKFAPLWSPLHNLRRQKDYLHDKPSDGGSCVYRELHPH